MPVGQSISFVLSAPVSGVIARADWSTVTGVGHGMTVTKTMKNPQAGAAWMR